MSAVNNAGGFDGDWSALFGYAKIAESGNIIKFFSEMSKGAKQAASSVSDSSRKIKTALAGISGGLKGAWNSLGLFGKVSVVITALAAVYAICEKISNIGVEANQKMEETVSGYQENVSEIEAVNQEVEDTQRQIDILQSKGSLSFVEQEDLANLQEQTRQLALQKEILEGISTAKAKEAAASVTNAVNKNFTSLPTNEAEINRRGERYYVTGYDEYDSGYWLDVPEKDLVGQIEKLRELKRAQNEVAEGGSDWEQLQSQIDSVTLSIWESASKLEDYRGKLKALPEDALSDADTVMLKNLEDSIEFIYKELSPGKWNQMKLDELYSTGSFAKAKSELVELASSMNTVGITVDDVTERFPELAKAAEEAGLTVQDIVNDINAVAGTFDPQKAKKFIINSFGQSGYIKEIGSNDDAMSKIMSFSEWVNTLDEDELTILYTLSLDTSSAEWSLAEWQKHYYEALRSADNYQSKLEQSTKDTATAISEIQNAQSLMAARGAGKTVTVEAMSADGMKEYASALEYVNGAYELNIEKVNELVEAKAQEQISVNKANKAYAQMKYLKNAKEIDKLNQELAEAKRAQSGNVDAIMKSIEALKEENSNLINECQQYDMLCTSLQNATSAYQHWVNSLSSADYGDLFSGTMSAVDKINETFKTGNFGSLQYKAALDLVIPEDIDKEDIAQVKAYVDSLNKYLTQENGKFTGLNINQFLKDAKASGLMSYDQASDYWSINPGVKLEDFREGLHLADGMVNAFFDQLRLKGGEFSFADELVQTFGDLAVKAYEAKDSLKDAFGEDYEVKIDVSDINDESVSETVNSLKNSISDELSSLENGGNVDLHLRPEIDTSELVNAGWDEVAGGIATVFTSTFSNKAGDIAVNFTPIIADKDGNYIGTLSPDELTEYAEGVISGVHDDYLNLQIGSEFSGEDAIEQASAAAERIHELHQELSDLNKADQIDIVDYAKLSYLEKTIRDMQDLKATPNVDASQVENANDIIQYCVRQIQLLNEPAIMKVDTSMVNGELGEAIALLQQFQQLSDAKQAMLAVDINADTSAFDSQMEDLRQKLQTNEAIKTELTIDTTSIDSIANSIGDIDVSALVELLPDAKAIEGYNPDTKQVDVIYNPDDSLLPESFESIDRTVNYVPDTTGLPNSFGSITRYVNYVKTGDVQLNGTAHAGGTARANGDWGTAPGGNTLVGELGREIVVDPRTGKWYTVGDRGAEFRNIPAGAIVFNHKQTESLLENGYAIGRARALVTGTAMVSGGISGGFVDYRPGNGGGSSGGSSSSSSSSSSHSYDSGIDDYERELEVFDWIEIAIDRIERAIEKLNKTAGSVYKSIKTKLNAANDEIVTITKEISLQEKAYKKYMGAAESVSLSSSLKQRVRDGTIDISQYDEDTKKLIDDYKELYEKALDCETAIDNLHESLADAYKGKFDNIQKRYSNEIDLLDKRADSLQNKTDMLEEQGYMLSANHYTEMIKVERIKIDALNRELTGLNSAFDDAMASGEIEEGSDAWYEMLGTIEDTKNAIDQANISMVNYANTIREIEWEYFDYAQGRISQIASEADFLQSLVESKDLYDEHGNLSEAGMASVGLSAEKYGVYMAQADKYADEIKRINKEIANDPNNTKLIQRRDELLASQRESILAANQEKQAMVDLVRNGIQVEMDAVRELIDAYTESLDSAKDLYEYQKRIADKAADITSLEKQLAAYQNDMSEETRSKIQKIQLELKNAKDDLKDTQYDRFVSESKKMLDTMYSEYEDVLNNRFDDAVGTFEKLIDTVNENFVSISDYFTKEAGDVGYRITDATKSIWEAGGVANGVVTEYGSKLSDGISAVVTTVEGIFGLLGEIAKQNGVSFIGAKSYSSGGLIDYTGIANVHGSPNDPEAVLSAKDTKNFIKLRDALRSMQSDDILRSNTNLFDGIRVPSVSSIDSRGTRGGGYSVGSISISIPIEHVEDYNDFVNQLRSDKKFEQMIQSMTVGRIAGKSSLEKNKYRW